MLVDTAQCEHVNVGWRAFESTRIVVRRSASLPPLEPCRSQHALCFTTRHDVWRRVLLVEDVREPVTSPSTPRLPFTRAPRPACF